MHLKWKTTLTDNALTAFAALAIAMAILLGQNGLAHSCESDTGGPAVTKQLDATPDSGAPVK